MDGIDISQLKAGTIVEARTRNTVYRMAVLGTSIVLIQGGKRHFQVPTRAQFNGAVIAGNAWLWTGKVILGMSLEFIFWPPKTDFHRVTTTPVEKVRIIGMNGLTQPIPLGAIVR